jgi:hypothetical protein
MIEAERKTPSDVPSRKAATLSPTLDKGLLGYVTAATAAGVGLFTLAQPAEAKIVYTEANIPITANGAPVPVDLNHDGVTDFSFINASGTCEHARNGAHKGVHKLGCSFASFYVVGGQAGNAIGSSQTFNAAQCAALLHAGRTIEAGKKFKSNEAELFGAFGTSGFFASACPFTGRGNPGGYLGLKFVSGNETYYGWALVELTHTGPVLAGYAYEDTPGGSIRAGATGPKQNAALQAPALTTPQPATLGLLANGARALPFWRRPEEMN